MGAKARKPKGANETTDKLRTRRPAEDRGIEYKVYITCSKCRGQGYIDLDDFDL